LAGDPGLKGRRRLKIVRAVLLAGISGVLPDLSLCQILPHSIELIPGDFATSVPLFEDVQRRVNLSFHAEITDKIDDAEDNSDPEDDPETGE
jgi:hypothetical protein